MKQIDIKDSEKLAKFFIEKNIIYVDENVIKTKLSFRKSKRYYNRNRESFLEDEKFYLDNIGQKQDLSIRESDNFNFGLFANEDIKAGTLIGQYSGLVSLASRFKKKTDYAWDYPAPCFPHLEIDARLYGNEQRFVNHSFEPNLKVDHIRINGEWIIYLHANRDIKKDEELFMDYGMAYWTAKNRELTVFIS